MTEIEEKGGETMTSPNPPPPSADGKEQPKPRLVIKSMVLENFKSYAGAQHVGPFHKVSVIRRDDVVTIRYSRSDLLSP